MGNCCSSIEGYYHTAPDDSYADLVKLTTDVKTGDILVLDENYGAILKPQNSRTSPRTPVLVATAVRTSHDGHYRLNLSPLLAEVAYGAHKKVEVRRVVVASLGRGGVRVDYQRAIETVRSTPSCSTVCDLFISLYRRLGYRIRDEACAKGFPECLPLSLPQVVPVPEIKVGPAQTGEIPFYHGWTTSDVDDKPHRNLEEVLPLLQTGDIVLMCGVGVAGAVIRVMDRAKYSHVGVIVRDPWIDYPCVWESTSNSANMVDIDTGRVVQGVGLTPLKDKLHSGWVTPVAVRQLRISAERRKEIEEIAVELRCKYKGRHFEEHPTEMIKAAVDFTDDYISIFKNKGGEASQQTLFCSELVALAYQNFRLLGDDPPANEYTPEDFADSRKLTLTQGVLEDEVYLDIP